MIWRRQAAVSAPRISSHRGGRFLCPDCGHLSHVAPISSDAQRRRRRQESV